MDYYFHKTIAFIRMECLYSQIKNFSELKKLPPSTEPVKWTPKDMDNFIDI